MGGMEVEFLCELESGSWKGAGRTAYLGEALSWRLRGRESEGRGGERWLVVRAGRETSGPEVCSACLLRVSPILCTEWLVCSR